jgi:hypothetical protein
MYAQAMGQSALGLSGLPTNPLGVPTFPIAQPPTTSNKIIIRNVRDFVGIDEMKGICGAFGGLVSCINNGDSHVHAATGYKTTGFIAEYVNTDLAAMAAKTLNGFDLAGLPISVESLANTLSSIAKTVTPEAVLPPPPPPSLHPQSTTKENAPISLASGSEQKG